MPNFQFFSIFESPST